MSPGELADCAALTDLVHRYAATIDDRDLDGLAACFAEGAVADYDGGTRLEGRAAIRAFMDRAFREGIGMATPSTHMMSNILISVDGDEAVIRTSAIACLTNRPGFVTVRGLRYIDRCVKEAGRWRFAHRRHVCDWQFDAPAGTIASGVSASAAAG
ncbi:nuclear transport factor 2 family protein [Rhizorhabdus dicambivorans]|nr:nuclear transport factor 2 family protein [Rhizorhabdus dicambivorans]